MGPAPTPSKAIDPLIWAFVCGHGILWSESPSHSLNGFYYFEQIKMDVAETEGENQYVIKVNTRANALSQSQKKLRMGLRSEMDQAQDTPEGAGAWEDAALGVCGGGE